MHSVLEDEVTRILNKLAIDVPSDLIATSRAPRFGHLQSNVALRMAKTLGVNAATLAQTIGDEYELHDYAKLEVVGGFLNFTLTPEAIIADLATDRRKVEEPETVVIDYSSPNVAKTMHVGHLRSTIIGDALARVLAYRGHTVVPQNHVGDWGTQFGMLIEAYLSSKEITSLENLDQLNELYKIARKRFDADHAFAERSRQRVVALQAGDKATLDIWRSMVEVSLEAFFAMYDRMDVLLNRDAVCGESFYNSALAPLIANLVNEDLLVPSEGALCFFSPEFKKKDGSGLPLILQKSDGGFGYAATDIAALKYRVNELGADRIIYVVDTRQALHFSQVFALGRAAEILPQHVRVEHVGFGTILGEDGKPFKTRSGETVALSGLLDQAVAKARTVLVSKGSEDNDAKLDAKASAIGIGAVKYADLSSQLHKDYTFTLDRMVSLDGNTGPYLQYAHARLHRMLSKVGHEGTLTLLTEPAELALAYTLTNFDQVLGAVEDTLEPHHLCTYLYELASAVATFYEACPVGKAEGEVKSSRIALACMAKQKLALGLDLLGIEALESM